MMLFNVYASHECPVNTADARNLIAMRQLEQVEDFGWLDLGRLAGFADVVEDVLAGNELLPSWFAGAAARQFELRVEQVGRAAEKSKTSP